MHYIMKAKDIFKYLLDKAIGPWDNTCDKLIAGDPEKEVYKLATCFKLTAEVVAVAEKKGIDMIITHEPTFSVSDRRVDANAIDLKKWDMLDKSDITVYRFHDHAHHSEPDYIHEGFIRALDLKIKKSFERESLGVCRYELDEDVTTKELAQRIKDVLGIENCVSWTWFCRLCSDT